MELITASELSRQTGLSLSSISNNAKKNIIPYETSEGGRKLFNLETAQAAILKAGIKGRTSKKKTSEPEAEAESPEAEAQDCPPATQVIVDALMHARRVFKKHLKAAIATGAGGEENELVLLRTHLRADELFKCVKEGFLE